MPVLAGVPSPSATQCAAVTTRSPVADSTTEPEQKWSPGASAGPSNRAPVAGRATGVPSAPVTTGRDGPGTAGPAGVAVAGPAGTGAPAGAGAEVGGAGVAAGPAAVADAAVATWGGGPGVHDGTVSTTAADAASAAASSPGRRHRGRDRPSRGRVSVRTSTSLDSPPLTRSTVEGTPVLRRADRCGRAVNPVRSAARPSPVVLRGSERI